MFIRSLAVFMKEDSFPQLHGIEFVDMLFELFNVRHCGNVKERVSEVADERKRRPLRARIGKRRGLLAPDHLFNKTKSGLNILTNVGRQTVEFR